MKPYVIFAGNKILAEVDILPRGNFFHNLCFYNRLSNQWGRLIFTKSLSYPVFTRIDPTPEMKMLELLIPK